MAKQGIKIKDTKQPLPTIWHVPDELWEEFIVPVLEERDPVAATGRSRINQRAALDGVIYVKRTGCQWEALPREFGAKSSVHRTYQRWVEHGVFERVWAMLIEFADEAGVVDWQWQSVDGAMGKARFGGIKSAPTPRIAARTA